MPFWRAFFRYLFHNEDFINKLADSKPMRRTAQFVVYILNRTGMINGTRGSISNPRDYVKQLKDIADKLKRQLEDRKK